MFLVALALSAHAAPTRCVATWTPREKACAARGSLTANAAGAGQPGAERAALKQLEKVLGLSIEAQRLMSPILSAADFAACSADLREHASVSCLPEAELAAEALCFVELADPACWDGNVLSVDGIGWEMVATGRQKMCEAVDARLVQLNYTDLATRRATCAAACASKTTVRCPQ
jgi:hypothetical protein